MRPGGRFIRDYRAMRRVGKNRPYALYLAWRGRKV
jgi:hypothetical protein